MPIASFTLNHDAHITSWSAGAAAWFGYAAAEVLGRHCRFLLSDAGLAALSEASSHAEAGLDYNRVVPVELADGGRREALLSCSPLTGFSGDMGLLCQVSEPSAISRSAEPASDMPSPHASARMAFMDAFVRTSPHGMGILDNDLRYVLVNDVLAAINGMSARDHIGRRVADVVRAADRGEYEKHLRKVLETGEPLHNVLISGRTEKSRDRDRVWSVTFFRLTSEDGNVLGLGGLIVDVTQKQTDLVEASAVRQRLDLVNQAGNKVGTTLEMKDTARELAEFVVPDFADLVTVEMRKDFLEGSRFPDAGKAVSTVRLAARTALDNRTGKYLFSGSGGEHVYAVGSTAHGSLCTGRPWHQHKLDGQRLGDIAEDEAVHALRESGLDSVVMAPLVARGRCLGLVTFARSTEREPLDEEDLKVAEELAARTALSLDNARMYDDERRIAVALQRNMLPGEKDIPVRPGLEIGYHYWSTSRSAKVGGDWFDVIPLSGHRIALVVGDMMGHDIQAAAGMGQMRTAMHTLARLDLEPVDLLNRLDNIVDVSPAMQYATCVYAVYNTVTRECSIANAGHPAPVLRHKDRSTELVPVEPGTPLGIGIGTSDFSVTDLVLPEDSTLVLCTDGLIERRGQDIDTGIAALRSALEAPVPPGFAVQQWCDNIVGQLTDWNDGDDLAVLMARAPAMPQHRCARWELSPGPGSASWARSVVRRTLHEWGLDDLQDTAQLLTNELVTNAILHGRGEIELQIALGGTLVVEVSDGDERLPHRARQTTDDEWGRGLTLVNEIAQKWGARSITSGKVVWFELPLQS